jgi:hypothetical protein
MVSSCDEVAIKPQQLRVLNACAAAFLGFPHPVFHPSNDQQNNANSQQWACVGLGNEKPIAKPHAK